ncbi:hypothetical protein DGG96_18775 [Legionella qingyii]|uniref:GNAT family N-acetyltransferase n=1 Tax=Legionella qingyii TaxID=2184757 RepID=A0A317TZX4_9GAMM|nr:GNAT family N-acetyltransferase [Legionella qingyii]PWY54087.1 hypothetical protein DGG96_18775 [Legionella qingyii]RUR19343.1 GNAT family N-acetyltransferase [Legionella qingyii]RUR21748.1 GNAT family N-acetyltransferase [Legionella qingyii]
MQLNDLIEIFRLPKITINLMCEKTIENDPFFAKIVKNYYQETLKQHKAFFFIKRNKYGVALCKLPKTFNDYFMQLEGSARRNYKKANKFGYSMQKINFNEHLEDVREIWLSTPIRQGLLPQYIIEGSVRSHNNPPSSTEYHDYPYFGIFKERKLIAYASCFVAGELCQITEIYGHFLFQKDGPVPMLIIDIAREILRSYPNVRYYSYGNYFGASKSMRRFKRKFLFKPHKVLWKLNSTDTMLIYRLDLTEMPSDISIHQGDFFFISGVSEIFNHFMTLLLNLNFFEVLKTCLKILSGRRILFGVKLGKTIIQSGWANIGFCKYYAIELNSIALGTLWTSPANRGQGLAPAALKHTIFLLYKKGFKRFYIDTTVSNQNAQRMIQKVGFDLIDKKII